MPPLNLLMRGLLCTPLFCSRIVPHCIFSYSFFVSLLPPVPCLFFSVFYHCKSFESFFHLYCSTFIFLNFILLIPSLLYPSACLPLFDCLCLCLSNINGHRAFKDRREIQREQMFLRCCHTVGMSAVVAPCCA